MAMMPSRYVEGMIKVVYGEGETSGTEVTYNATAGSSASPYVYCPNVSGYRPIFGMVVGVINSAGTGFEAVNIARCGGIPAYNATAGKYRIGTKIWNISGSNISNATVSSIFILVKDEYIAS